MENKETLEKRTEDYQEPSFLEVAGKMKRDINHETSSLAKSIVKSSPYQFVESFIRTSSGLAIAPYILPSALNALDNEPNDSQLRKWCNPSTNTAGGFIGGMLGLTTGALSYITQVPIWMGLVHEYGLKVLAIPVITNCASEIYERYRNTKQQMSKDRRRRKNF